MTKKRSIMITGGGGYVGSLLVPKLLADGHEVTVLDLFMYGQEVFDNILYDPCLRLVKGDLRDIKIVKNALYGCDTVIHLACISNDPSFELNPDLGKSINYDCFLPLVQASKDVGVSQFIYASSSSVYGIKDDEEVTENLSLEPLTDYSKFKAMCEDVLLAQQEDNFVTTIVRPATVCGYAPRQRLDVIVNILTNNAVNKRSIKVFGGEQKRPNIAVKDMVRAYRHILEAPKEVIKGKIYNVGFENHTVETLANMVKKIVGSDVTIEKVPTNDLRSYHISSKKITEELGFVNKFTIENAISDLSYAMDKKILVDPLNNPNYINIKVMQNINLE
jgi:nucleoside-diphosphate-sugar epimerase